MDFLLQKGALYVFLSLFWLIFYHFVGFEVSVILILLIIMIK
jgi:hypothetical protein